MITTIVDFKMLSCKANSKRKCQIGKVVYLHHPIATRCLSLVELFFEQLLILGLLLFNLLLHVLTRNLLQTQLN